MKKLSYVVAACIMLVALLVVTVRLLTPVLDQHRGDIEHWASDLLQMPVKIKEVRLSWHQYQPGVCINEVTILSRETREPILQIQTVRVFFSLHQSLWQRQLVPSSIFISGTDMSVHETEKGELSIVGFPSFGGFNDEPYKKETKFADLMKWLSAQPRLVLNDIDVRYTGYNNIKRYITLFDLRFENNGENHSIFGKAELHQNLPTNVDINIAWSGKEFDLATLKAKIYLHISGFSIAQWLKGLSWNGWQMNKGVANAKVWAWWSDNKFNRIQGAFETYDLNLYSATDKSTHVINRLRGDIGWKQEGNAQIIAGDDIFIDLPSRLWPSTSFYVALSPDANGQLQPTAMNVGYINIPDAEAFLFSSPSFISKEWIKNANEMKLDGDIQSASIIFKGVPTDVSQTSLTINLGHIGVAAWHGLPGIKNLSAVVNWNGQQGTVALHSLQTTVQYDSLFTQPLLIDQLGGDITWHKANDTTLVIGMKDVQAMSPGIALNTNGTLTILSAAPSTKQSKNASSTVKVVSDLTAHFAIPKANLITRYLPMRLFGADLIEWLNQAFLLGEIQSGNITLAGSLDDFPFEKGNGKFEISGKVKNLTLHFAPHWPDLTNLNGDLLFLGRKMNVNVDSARLEDIEVTHVQGEIPYLGDDKPQILTVKSDRIAADFSEGLRFIHHSPLEKTIGRMFTDASVSGPLVLNLSLTIPLSNTDNTKVDGTIALQDAMLELVPWNLTLKQLNGSLHFTEDTTDAKNITGILFDKPLQLDIKTISKRNAPSVIRASMVNRLSVTDLETWLKQSFSQYATGETGVNLNVDFALDQPVQVNVQTNLNGIAVNLPDQFAKKAPEVRPLTANITVQEHQPLRIKMQYGKLVGVAAVLERKKEIYSLVGANLRLGNGDPTWPATNGLYITGTMGELTWDKIRQYMNQPTSSELKLKAIDVTIAKLQLPGQTLPAIRVQVVPTDTSWDISLTNANIDGRIVVPSAFSPQALITAEFSRLNLNSVTNAPSKETIDVKSLPAINFNANTVTYNNMTLGQVSFKTVSTPNGLDIQSLKMTSPRIELKAAGEWTQSKGKSQTHLQGSANSSNVSGFLNGLKLDTHNLVAGKGKMDFNVNWNAPPYSPALSGLTGKLWISLGQGRIVDVGETSSAKMDLGKMLSIFSLQTIPRRLNLDFSDVVQKGYSFDTFRGDFTFQNGSASTNNARFEGPVARVDILGRIGLAAQDYDFTLSVTPHVTSSIPVAATLLTGQPVIGLAAWAVDKAISNGVTKATTYYYLVTGTWANPTWKSASAPR